MPWNSIEDVPANIRTHDGAKLTLAQANRWAALFDAISEAGGVENPAAVAWAQFVREFQKTEDGTGWVKREKALSLSITRDISQTTILQGNSVQALLDQHKPEGENKAWLVFRKREGKNIRGWDVDEMLIIDEPTEEILKELLWEGEFKLFEVNPSIGEALGHAIIDELPVGGIGFKIENEKTITPITEGELQEFVPPEADDAPEQVKAILKVVYQSCREKWAKENPSDIENPTNKESCSKQSWGAVENAGWKKDEEGKWVKGEASNLSSTECEIIDCPTCKDDKMFSFVPKLEQLSEEDVERTGQTELLTIDGLAIAEGVWKGTKFSVEVLKEAIERVSNKRIDVEHEDESWEDVKGFNYKPRWSESEKGIQIQGVIFDERVLNWYKRNPDTKIGLSVKLSPEAKFELIDGQKTCTYFDIKGIALTLNPACKVCWIKSADLVQLSSPDNKSGGGIEMADKKKTPEELAAEKKLADEKLAEEKKTVDAKKLEDEKKTKLAEDKAKEDKLNKEKEDAATAKLAAANSELDAGIEKRFSDMQSQIDTLTQANKTLSNERSVSETKAMVDDLITTGQLSEAKREDATKTLLALSSNEARAAFLNTIGGQNWKADEQGLVLSEDDKDKDKDKDLEFSEPERGIIT